MTLIRYSLYLLALFALGLIMTDQRPSQVWEQIKREASTFSIVKAIEQYRNRQEKVPSASLKEEVPPPQPETVPPFKETADEEEPEEAKIDWSDMEVVIARPPPPSLPGEETRDYSTSKPPPLPEAEAWIQLPPASEPVLAREPEEEEEFNATHALEILQALRGGENEKH